MTGANPDAIVYDPFTRAVFTFNGRGNNATVIDAATLKIVATLPLGGTPEFAASDGGGKIFVDIEDTGEIVTIDAKALKVLTRWSLAPCAEPSGLAMDVAHARLFSVCNNKKLMVTDAHSGRRVAELPIGEGPDAAAFDPARGLVFSSNREGSLTVIHEDDPDHYRVIATVPTRKSARTMALDPATHRIYLAAAEFGPAPAPTASTPRPRPAMLPDSFVILVVADN